MIVAIVAAEVAFWVVVVTGLALRYLARAPRAGGVVLAAVPLVDLALVVFVAVDVAHGAPPTVGHALAAVYLGATLAFGRPLVHAADVRFAHRFAGGPAPVRPAKGSRAAVRALWVEWARVVVAAVIAAVGLGVLLLVEGHGLPRDLDEAGAHPYWGTLLLLASVTGIWFLAGPAFAGRGRPSR